MLKIKGKLLPEAKPFFIFFFLYSNVLLIDLFSKRHVLDFSDFFRWCATPKITNYKLTGFYDFRGGASVGKNLEKKHGHVL